MTLCKIQQDPLKDSADWAKERTFQEPPRKKSHWDFVLEEMAWLANDFMQVVYHLAVIMNYAGI